VATVTPTVVPTDVPTWATDLGGSALAAVRDLGDRAVLCDLYDRLGAEIYHDTGILDDSEIRELARLVRGRPGPVLELAAGSGRLTVPLLRMGLEVTALEKSPGMADLLRAHAAEHRTDERLRVVEADMSDFDLGRRFETVVLGTSSVSLLDHDQRVGLLDAVRRHLTTDGVLLISIADVLEDQAAPSDRTYELVGRSGRRYRMHQHWDAGDDHRTVCVHPLDTGADLVPVAVSRPRVFDKRTLVAELERAGYDVVAEHPVSTRTQITHDVLLEARP
jgi:phospholipid N-methyltransferase